MLHALKIHAITLTLLLVVAVLFMPTMMVQALSQPKPQPKPIANVNINVNVIAGATGYIGKAVVKESVRQGYNTVALVRDADKVKLNKELVECFQGATIVQCDVCDAMQLNQVNYEI